MKKSRFTEHQIIKILKEVEAGRTAKDVCREHSPAPSIDGRLPYPWQHLAQIISWYKRIFGR